MDASHPLELAIDHQGVVALARALGVTHQAIRKWQVAGRLPRTEWTGETRYAERIEELTAGLVTKSRLLAPWPKVVARNEPRPVDAELIEKAA